MASSEAKRTPRRAATLPRPTPAEIGATLIAEVQQAGRFLRIPNPGDEERARYRRAFEAARQRAPEGYSLKQSGRARRDFFLGLQMAERARSVGHRPYAAERLTDGSPERGRLTGLRCRDQFGDLHESPRDKAGARPGVGAGDD